MFGWLAVRVGMTLTTSSGRLGNLFNKLPAGILEEGHDIEDLLKSEKIFDIAVTGIVRHGVMLCSIIYGVEVCLKIPRLQNRL